MAALPDARVVHALFERYSVPLYSFCLRRLGSREEAEDAVQSTFLNALRALDRGVRPRSESAWLYSIAENVCLTSRRSFSRRRRIEAPSDLGAASAVVPAHPPPDLELVPLLEALATLPERQRKALLLRELHGLSYREIGAELGLSQPAVETALFRARRSLVTAARSGIRGVGRVASVLSGLKALLGGGTAAVKVAVVVTAAVGGGVVMGSTAAPPAHHPAHRRPARQLSEPPSSRRDARAARSRGYTDQPRRRSSAGRALHS